MRRKLLITFLAFTTALLLALETPLALSAAMNEFHHLAVARLTATTRFATLAVPPLRGEESLVGLRRELVDFDRRNDVLVLVLDSSGEIVLTSRPGIALDDEQEAQVRQVLGGAQQNPLAYPYNLRAKPLFVAQPVVSGSTVLGVVATVSPTEALRESTINRALALVAVGLAGLAAAGAAAAPFARWILRPIRRLDHIAQAITAGSYEQRANLDHGPPEIRGLAESFDTMTDRLVTLLHTQRSFVTDASHQIRNPLTALRLRVESLQPMVTAAGQPHVDLAIAQVERLSKTLDELLRLAHADTGPSTMSEVDVLAVAEERAAAWQPKAEAGRIGIDVVGEDPVARCAQGTVEQTLDVLIDDALHVSPADGRIRVVLDQDDHHVRVHVLDEGPGMNPEDRSRACDRFWRGSTSAGRDGSGLGLSIAKALAVASGGELHLDAAVPHGVDAVLRLPRAHAPQRPVDRNLQEDGKPLSARS